MEHLDSLGRPWVNIYSGKIIPQLANPKMPCNMYNL